MDGMRHNYKMERQGLKWHTSTHKRTPMIRMVPMLNRQWTFEKRGTIILLPWLQSIWTMAKMHHAKTTNKEYKKSCCTMPTITRQRIIGKWTSSNLHSQLSSMIYVQVVQAPKMIWRPSCTQYSTVWSTTCSAEKFMMLLPQHDMMDAYSLYAHV